MGEATLNIDGLLQVDRQFMIGETHNGKNCYCKKNALLVHSMTRVTRY